MTDSATRRGVLATGAAALAVGCVSCGNDSGGQATDSVKETESAKETEGVTEKASAAAAPSMAPAGQDLARTSDVPVGGGKVFAAEQVVVTQPVKGEFKAFSAICTHQNCTVATVANGMINCPCHSSLFHVADGSVAHGPAMQPLAPAHITVDGNSIRLT
ncbi:Rieske (2Fe-2S) protein [Streptomyces sp. NPDC001978]|uniref:Rieske (2Fe-2S) protein n=1 Tax=Streptomyces sp. NPDC001978 TaxID=3364627 RepID=UPI00368CA9F2